MEANRKDAHNNTIIPVATASCGLFGVSDDFYEESLSLDERFVKNKKSTFFFKASGQSMEPYIFTGDVLVIDRSLKPKSNQICVIALDGQMICKRMIFAHGRVYLRSDNHKFKDIIVTEEMEMVVWGVVVAIARGMV